MVIHLLLFGALVLLSQWKWKLKKEIWLLYCARINPLFRKWKGKVVQPGGAYLQINSLQSDAGCNAGFYGCYPHILRSGDNLNFISFNSSYKKKNNNKIFSVLLVVFKHIKKAFFIIFVQFIVRVMVYFHSITFKK